MEALGWNFQVWWTGADARGLTAAALGWAAPGRAPRISAVSPRAAASLIASLLRPSAAPSLHPYFVPGLRSTQMALLGLGTVPSVPRGLAH